MRLILRKERPHFGAQLRITDAGGMRIPCFAAHTPDRPIAELELRHRLRARAEDRIRVARPPACAACPSRTRGQPRTARSPRSGWRSSRSPSTCWPGCPCLPSPAGPDAGNAAACDSACFPRPPTRYHLSAQDSPPHPTLALARRDHHCPRTTRAAAHPRPTSNFLPSRRQHHLSRAVEPDATTGRRPAHHTISSG